MWTDKEPQSAAYATSPEDGGVSVGSRGGTSQDKKDMYRVGRDQELNVRHPRTPEPFL